MSTLFSTVFFFLLFLSFAFADLSCTLGPYICSHWYCKGCEIAMCLGGSPRVSSLFIFGDSLEEVK
ncbi:hypothetical protein PRIPAC_87029 [Pristionchus pacificus]|uniref:Uncharacterized protein n=1 Tax=Pristionchus pacificus TaxID=54126 RepID=A0A2A6BNG9_PRIPA|nr:hypothetical protein PRIPAC_87029 [Pristionchus pacificus]|eukprot:PDM67301.1 hypothetical protein PRIPAC_48718 [Pristionchus pacificus]